MLINAEMTHHTFPRATTPPWGTKPLELEVAVTSFEDARNGQVSTLFSEGKW